MHQQSSHTQQIRSGRWVNVRFWLFSFSDVVLPLFTHTSRSRHHRTSLLHVATGKEVMITTFNWGSLPCSTSTGLLSSTTTTSSTHHQHYRHHHHHRPEAVPKTQVRAMRFRRMQTWFSTWNCCASMAFGSIPKRRRKYRS